jgi:hypothetical protein
MTWLYASRREGKWVRIREILSETRTRESLFAGGGTWLIDGDYMLV